MELLLVRNELNDKIEILPITLVTAFFWRHRFLHDLVRKNYKEKISGPYIELTQFVTLENVS